MGTTTQQSSGLMLIETGINISITCATINMKLRRQNTEEYKKRKDAYSIYIEKDYKCEDVKTL